MGQIHWLSKEKGAYQSILQSPAHVSHPKSLLNEYGHKTHIFRCKHKSLKDLSLFKAETTFAWEGLALENMIWELDRTELHPGSETLAV